MGFALRKRANGPFHWSVDLHPKQLVAFGTDATEVLYGGAAGGGKSHLMRVAAISWCAIIPGLQVYIFRRIREDLMKNHMEGPKGFRAMLASAANSGHVQIIEDEIRFANGSKIFLCHCKDPKDVYKYQGAEIHVLIIDELTHFLEPMYRFLRNRVRMVGLKDRLPPWLKDKFPRILCSANPGNVGHLWVKSTWIDGRVPLSVERMSEQDGGMLRQYIPARLDDNPSLRDDDPDYEKRLAGLGSEALVKAMRDGDWDVVEGAFFSEWSNTRHVLKPFPVPASWLRFVSVDWGSARPFSVGWWAVVGDDYPVVCSDGNTRVIPRGALVRYREWYGVQRDDQGKPKANEGLKLEIETFGIGLLRRSIPDLSLKKEDGSPVRYAYVVMDPAMWNADGGPSLAERLMRARPDLGYPGIQGLRKADNARISARGQLGGWDIVRARLRGSGWTESGPGPDWVPDLYVFETCTDFVRTFPVLQHDPDRPEDVNTDMEDHIGDETRYACKSRPYVPKAIDKPVDKTELEYEAIKGPDGVVRVQSTVSILERANAKAKAKRRK